MASSPKVLRLFPSPHFVSLKFQIYFSNFFNLKFSVFSILVLGTLSLSLCKFEQQSTHLCVLHFRQFRITGSDLNWGIAAVIGELDHGDAVQTFPAKRFKLLIGLREREWLTFGVIKEGMFEDLSLANKQLRFVLIFLMVCLLLNRREMVRQLLNQLKVLVDECKRTFQPWVI
ncbi:uncharacterized protein [Pyrus communis]|uniref:uncharacterized protein isoform X3 n=1 Tax=Pyrus communis TaxID=23211 RepID=UPI0035BF3AD6